MSALLWLLRFQHDAKRGARLEDLTRRETDFAVERHCGLLLAQMRIDGKLAHSVAHMPEGYYGTPTPMCVLAHIDAIYDFKEFLREDVIGYRYAPLHMGSENFGYHSDTPFWLHPNKDTPVLIFRPGTDPMQSEPQAMIGWLAYWDFELLARGLASGPWPDGTNKNENVPEEFEKMMQRQPTKHHRRRRLRLIG